MTAEERRALEHARRSVDAIFEPEEDQGAGLLFWWLVGGACAAWVAAWVVFVLLMTGRP